MLHDQILVRGQKYRTLDKTIIVKFLKGTYGYKSCSVYSQETRQRDSKLIHAASAW